MGELYASIKLLKKKQTKLQLLLINPLEESPRKNVSDIQGKKYFITNDKCLNKPNNWSISMATFSFSSYRNKAITIIYFIELK